MGNISIAAPAISPYPDAQAPFWGYLAAGCSGISFNPRQCLIAILINRTASNCQWGIAESSQRCVCLICVLLQLLLLA